MKIALISALFCTGLGAISAAQPVPGSVVWSFDTGNWVQSSPALGADGAVYVGIATGLCAITNNGSVASNKWVFPCPISHSSPTVGPDQTVYIASSDGSLYALAANGSKMWSFALGGAAGSASIAVDNTIYVQSPGYLNAISPDGRPKWRSPVAGSVAYASPSIAPDGTVYVTSFDASSVYAFAPDGTKKWEQPGTGHAGDSAAIGLEGRVFVAEGPLYALRPDATQIWYTMGFFDGVSPVLGKDGTVYARSADDHQMCAINQDGQVVWRAFRDLQQFAPATAPAVDDAGVLYYCVSNSIVALSGNGLVQWSIYGGSSIPGVYLANTSPIISGDGTVYACLGTKVYAIFGTNGPAKSPWPMYRQNSRGTGKLEKANLRLPQKRSDANFEFQLYPQQLGLTYTVESTTNLNTWTSLTSFVATALPMPVVDFTASNSPSKFYRAWSPPP